MPLDMFPYATRMVVDLLGPLCRVGARFELHHLQPLELYMYHLFVHGRDRRQWVARVGSALSLLEDAFDQHASVFGPMFAELAVDNGATLHDVYTLAPNAWSSAQAETPDEKFRPLRDLYASAHEGLYRQEMAVFVAADAVLGGATDLTGLIDDDGKVTLGQIALLEGRRGLRPGLLMESVNTGLRNSIAHSRYEVLSEDRIKMWDRRPGQSGYTWGPEQLTHAELHRAAFTLLETCESMSAAKIMFDVNNNRVMSERGYFHHQPMRLRLDVAENRIEHSAATLGFKCERVTEPDEDTLHIALRISGERDDQPTMMWTGGPSGVREFIQRVETHDVAIRHLVYTLIQRTRHEHETYQTVIVDVTRPNGDVVGRVVANAEAKRIMVEEPLSVEEMRARLDEDSLPDETMPVVTRDLPTET